MLAAVALVAATATAPSAPSLADKLDRWLIASDFKGNVLVWSQGAVVLRKGYGLADRENNVAYDADTVFSIGSITKQFTAAAILKLEMQGKLRVEDTIAKHLTGVPDDKKGITLHQLLTHTSGLDSDFAGDYDPVQRDEYVKRILASKLRTKPGDAYFYSNAGYSLLAAIVEIASGVPYEKFLRDNLFLPAGMKETGYKLPAWPPARIAVGYHDAARWGRITEKPWAPDGPYWALRGNGGIHSTLDDMLRWHKALLSDTVLTSAEREKMFRRHVSEGPGSGSSYGYGWSLRDADWGGRLIEHNGGNGTFFADVLRFVDDDLVVILSTNDSQVRGGRISHALARIAHGDDVPPLKPPGGPLAPLDTAGRDAIVRSWFDAFNAQGVDAMRAFWSTRQLPRPGVTDADREKRLGQMRDDLGHLEPLGILERDDAAITVRARSANGPHASLKFNFAIDDKIQGISVELGE
jgi:CubicO group peptidase (beta-lactamase class C family)